MDPVAGRRKGPEADKPTYYGRRAREVIRAVKESPSRSSLVRGDAGSEPDEFALQTELNGYLGRTARLCDGT